MVMIRMRAPAGVGVVFLGDGSRVTVDGNGLFSCDSQYQPALEAGGCSTSIGGTLLSAPYPGSGSSVQPRRGDSYFDTTVNQELNFDGTGWRKADGTLRIVSGQVMLAYPAQGGVGCAAGAC